MGGNRGSTRIFSVSGEKPGRPDSRKFQKSPFWVVCVCVHGCGCMQGAYTHKGWQKHVDMAGGILSPPPLVVPHPLSFPGGGGGLGQPKIFRCGSLCCSVGDCGVGYCHLNPLHSWQDILLIFAEMELDSTTMFPPGTNVMFMGEECLWCMGCGTQFWEQGVFYKGHSRREMGPHKSACACQASYQEGKTTTQECCPKHFSGKWRACARVQGEVEQDQEILYRAGQGVGLRTLAAL